LKRILLFVFIVTSILQARNFRDDMVYYKNENFKEHKISFELASKKDYSIQLNFILGKIHLYKEGSLLYVKKEIKYFKRYIQSDNLRTICFLSKTYIKNDLNNDIKKQFYYSKSLKEESKTV